MVSSLIVGWYVLGLIGSALVFEFMFRRNSLNITTGDVIFGCFIAIGGPINFFVGFCWALLTLVDNRQ